MAKLEGVSRVDRRTVDLSAYPDLIVIYLGLRLNALAGLKTILGLGPQIADSVKAKPDGLLLHESIIYSVFPLNTGMRQYWRDFDSLERWTRSDPHRIWWQNFLRDSGGTGFWHETYALRGGFEAIYDGVPQSIGMMKFAPLQPAIGRAFSARERLGREGSGSSPVPVSETDLKRDS